MTTQDQSGLTADNVVAFIGDVFDRCGDDEYLGEPVTVAEHMLQGATLAENGNMSTEIIVGALLHDIGHFTSEFGTFSMDDTQDRYHEEAGAQVLATFFPPVVVDCVRYHVAAKRYLCATRPDYLDQLTEASRHSLKLQGGPMNEDEVAEFNLNPNLDVIVQVRLLDDGGKVAGVNTPPYEHFAPLIQQMVNQHAATALRT
ncbi:MAG: HD domain-containing protein [Granulosicoccaceae bacterium]